MKTRTEKRDQFDILVQEVEGRVNDYDAEGDKDETIKSLVFLVGDCALNAVNSKVKEIISLIDEMVGKYKKAENFNGIRREVLTELKNKIGEIK